MPFITRQRSRAALLQLALAVSLVAHLFTAMVYTTGSAGPKLVLVAQGFYGDDHDHDAHFVRREPEVEVSNTSLCLAPGPPMPSAELLAEDPPEKTYARSPARNAVNHIPDTVMLEHAPGWTVFTDIYMANGTFFVVTLSPPSSFPESRFMISTGMRAENTPENKIARLPTDHELSYITPEEARRRWGEDGEDVRTVDGNTLLFNDPSQFLDHYYHFCAELLFGTWTFWSGIFPKTDLTASKTPDRAIFPHTNPGPSSVGGGGWRDRPGFNAFFLRAVYPSLAVETASDWEDRVRMTSDGTRAWRFPTLLLADRSAAFHGALVGADTHRTAAPPYYPFARTGRINTTWWEPARAAVLARALPGVKLGSPALGPLPSTPSTRTRPTLDELLALADFSDETGIGSAFDPRDVRLRVGLEAGNKVERLEGRWDEVAFRAEARRAHRRRPKPAGQAVFAADAATPPFVVTYVSRQNSKDRQLSKSDHEALVAALEELCVGRGWELNVPLMEHMSIEEQLVLAARTTVLVGVHGNGLSHLLMMPPTRRTTVIEIYYPEGFAQDYEWTARALGFQHHGVWNDTSFTWPNTPWVQYVDGFHGTHIPVHAPTVVNIIKERLDGYL